MTAIIIAIIVYFVLGAIFTGWASTWMSQRVKNPKLVKLYLAEIFFLYPIVISYAIYKYVKEN